MGTDSNIRRDIDAAIDDLEQLADEIRVKIHLASMDASDVWTRTLEPRLVEARRHAKEASASSRAAIDETLKAVRDFAGNIEARR